MIKRILYVAFQYESGQKENGHAINYKAWYEGFVDLGFEVEALFYEDYSREELQLKILENVDQFEPHLVFFILQDKQIDFTTLSSLMSKGVFTVNFFGDDQWRFDQWSSLYAPYFCACITTDKYCLDKYNKVGQINIIRSQWASLDSKVEYRQVNYKYDVSFVGSVSAYRKWFVSELGKRGVKVECFGNGWENGRLTYDEMEQVFRNSKINLNISNSFSYDTRYILSGFKTFLRVFKAYITGRGKNSSQIKARNFEILAQGGFQVTDYVPSLEDYLHIGEEVVCYSGVDEAMLQIKYYMSNSVDREKIKEQGVEKARSYHTFKSRIIEFMPKLNEIKKHYDEND